MIAIGLDLSLTHTGVARWSEHNKQDNMAHAIKPVTKGQHRLSVIKHDIVSVLSDIDNPHVAIEGYAMSKGGGRYQNNNQGRAFDLGELGGIIKNALYEMKIPTIIVSPRSLKKFIALDGNATKEQVMSSLADRYGVETDDDNIADAYGLAIMAYRFFRKQRCQRTEERTALASVEQIIWQPAPRRRR